jgi:hypothetical protein
MDMDQFRLPVAFGIIPSDFLIGFSSTGRFSQYVVKQYEVEIPTTLRNITVRNVPTIGTLRVLQFVISKLIVHE